MGPPLLSTVLKAREQNQYTRSHPNQTSSSPRGSSVNRHTSYRFDQPSSRNSQDVIESSRQASNSLSSAFHRLQALHTTLLDLQRHYPPSQSPPIEHSMGPPHVALILSSEPHPRDSHDNASNWYSDALESALGDDGIPLRLQQLRSATLNLSNVSAPGRVESPASISYIRDEIDRRSQRESMASMGMGREFDSEGQLQAGSTGPLPPPSRRRPTSTTSIGSVIPLSPLHVHSRRRPIGIASASQTLPSETSNHSSETLLGLAVAAREAESTPGSSERAVSNNWDTHGQRLASSSARILVREHSSGPWIAQRRYAVRPDAVWNTHMDRPSTTQSRWEGDRVLPFPPASMTLTAERQGVEHRRVHETRPDRLYVVRRRLNSDNIEEVTHISLDGLDFDPPVVGPREEIERLEESNPLSRVRMPRQRSSRHSEDSRGEGGEVPSTGPPTTSNSTLEDPAAINQNTTWSALQQPLTEGGG